VEEQFILFCESFREMKNLLKEQEKLLLKKEQEHSLILDRMKEMEKEIHLNKISTSKERKLLIAENKELMDCITQLKEYQETLSIDMEKWKHLADKANQTNAQLIQEKEMYLTSQVKHMINKKKNNEKQKEEEKAKHLEEIQVELYQMNLKKMENQVIKLKRKLRQVLEENLFIQQKDHKQQQQQKELELEVKRLNEQVVLREKVFKKLQTKYDTLYFEHQQQSKDQVEEIVQKKYTDSTNMKSAIIIRKLKRMLQEKETKLMLLNEHMTDLMSTSVQLKHENEEYKIRLLTLTAATVSSSSTTTTTPTIIPPPITTTTTTNNNKIKSKSIQNEPTTSTAVAAPIVPTFIPTWRT
jgi:hypothetical protein